MLRAPNLNSKESKMFEKNKIKIGVIGLGYVGLPLAVEFSKHFEVIGFDIDPLRISELNSGIDRTLEIEQSQLKLTEMLKFTAELSRVRECNVFIVTVPTPIDVHNKPDFKPLLKASKLIGQIIKKNDVVIFESTVFPGATEEECIPIIESTSNLVFNRDFFAGYSPERINPGDKQRGIRDIVKVTSGSTEKIADFVDELYGNIVAAGTHKTSSIAVAEAAKVIENIQRDVNIALINELAIIFDKLGLDTTEVLEAAGTKWNFLPFKPGLVGGHCIGVDPYYLTHKAQELGYHPEMILAGRKINDGMSEQIASKLIKKMITKEIEIRSAKILILGYTFKEDCPDIRNTKVGDIVAHLLEYTTQIELYDPFIKDRLDITTKGILVIDHLKSRSYDAIILAVTHKHFIKMGSAKIRSLGKKNHVFFDVKSIFPQTDSDIRL